MATPSTSSAPVPAAKIYKQEEIGQTSGFGNNCGLNCLVHFICSEENLKKYFPKGGEPIGQAATYGTRVRTEFNTFYGTTLTSDQMRDLLEKNKNPKFREMLLGPVIREMMKKDVDNNKRKYKGDFKPLGLPDDDGSKDFFDEAQEALNGGGLIEHSLLRRFGEKLGIKVAIGSKFPGADEILKQENKYFFDKSALEDNNKVGELMLLHNGKNHWEFIDDKNKKLKQHNAAMADQVYPEGEFKAAVQTQLQAYSKDKDKDDQKLDFNYMVHQKPKSVFEGLVSMVEDMASNMGKAMGGFMNPSTAKGIFGENGFIVNLIKKVMEVFSGLLGKVFGMKMDLLGKQPEADSGMENAKQALLKPEEPKSQADLDQEVKELQADAKKLGTGKSFDDAVLHQKNQKAADSNSIGIEPLTPNDSNSNKKGRRKSLF